MSGSKPEPAEAKLVPVISSSMLSFGSKYGGTYSFTPTYEAVPLIYQNTQKKKLKKILKNKKQT